jgi:5'-3' exonuclease
MGIPAYFAYIAKNHTKIIKKIQYLSKVHNLLFDCNSIIYDAIRELENEKKDMTEQAIFDLICKKVEQYIYLVKPTNVIYIAFDGVAPVAKLEQQRNRRHKSSFEESILQSYGKAAKMDTTQITPGTEFMKKLSNKIETYFNDPKKFGVEKLIISTSNEVGEGEHKLYEHIRKNPLTYRDFYTVIYGLDADLIMLTINHLRYSKNMFLFRETPEFIKTIDKTLKPNELYILDIFELSNTIAHEMNMSVDDSSVSKLYDYIFITFLLGNDFIPHSPAINIRTNGIDYIMDAYANTLGSENKTIVENNEKINWKHFRQFMEYLKNNEHAYIKHEYSMRNKRKRSYKTSTLEDIQYKFLNLPTIDRSVEEYINPNEDKWQERYYKALFDIEITEPLRKKICINFLEALEWTFKYYTIGCCDWRWKYNYDYPPLLEDLYKYIPYFDNEFITNKDINPISPIVQLCYVLPIESHKYLSKDVRLLLSEKREWYTNDFNFKWAFCKYFWEAHVELPHIDINQLEKHIG